MIAAGEFIKRAALFSVTLAVTSPLALPRPMSAQTTVYCVYAGQNYSVGAQLANGQVCSQDGTWTKVKSSQP
jgi:hypothetical protein